MPTKKRWKQMTPEARSLKCIKDRCLYASPGTRRYRLYQGRGIKVCERWLGRSGYQNFLADMGPRPGPGYSIDRIDNNGNYEPGNCQWATRSQQQRNRRDNLCVEFEGKQTTVIEVAEKIGITYHTLKKRVRAGWSTERALNTPVQKRKKLLKPGQRFGKRTVLQLAQVRRGGSYYDCRCNCGDVSEVRGTDLARGVSDRCSSCAAKERERLRRCNSRPRHRRLAD